MMRSIGRMILFVQPLFAFTFDAFSSRHEFSFNVLMTIFVRGSIRTNIGSRAWSRCTTGLICDIPFRKSIWVASLRFNF